MKNTLLTTLILLGSISVFSQTNFGKEWVIGRSGYKIKFDNPLTHDTSGIFIFFGLGSSNVCDSSGNIILQSNGMNVYDRNINYIDGGDTLATPGYYEECDGDGPIPQYSLFMPMENKKYYFVTATMNDTMLYNFHNIHGWKAPYNLLLYNVIDMNMNGGAGKVVKRMVPIVENVELLKVGMQACRHANGKDWWLLKMAGDSVNGNRIFKFLFTQDSVYNMGVQTMPYPFEGYFDLFGQMQFSPDGNTWAFARSRLPGMNYLYLANFDRCTGILSNFSKIIPPPQATGFPPGDVQADTANTGLCFSPNGKNLYISRYSHILQYHIPTQSFYKVYGMDTTYDYFAGYTSLALGADNKVYIGHFHGISKQMSVIDNPNGIGATCSFCRKCLRSKNPESWHCILNNPPNLPNYELGADTTKPCWPLSSGEVYKQSSKIKLYPNPFNNDLTIDYSLQIGEVGKIVVYTLLGVPVYETELSNTVNRVTMQLPNLPIGVYLYKYFVNNRLESTGKLLKQ